MAIKVQFHVGESNATVTGLYQWDYGQVLEIECAEIGFETLEVHFACPNMSEAIVRTCTFSDGVGTVEIPDECLEQASSVTAWLCRRDSTQRHTIKTIILPLTARTRPGNMLDDITASYTDAVGQLIEEINEAVDALENGEVTVAKANEAVTAGHATTAGSATNATYATSAGSAGSATTATTANTANAISASFVLTATVTDGKATVNLSSLEIKTLYLAILECDTYTLQSGIFIINNVFNYSRIGQFNLYCRGSTADNGKFEITIFADSSSSLSDPNGEISFYKIGGIS